MKSVDINLLSDEDLRERLKAERDMLGRLKFAHAISPIENPMKIRASRKVVAKLNTEVQKRNKTA